MAGAVGKRPTRDKKGRCGTNAGYAAHRRRGEQACQKCKNARAAYARKNYAEGPVRPKRKAKAAPAALAVVEAPAPAPVPETPPMAAPRPATPAVEPNAEPGDVPEAPDWLKAKGRALWEDVTRAYDLTPAALVLLGEACRTTDRLERMAAALSSRSTLWFEVGDIDQADEAGVPIVVNGMIGEARQLQNQLRQTLGQLGVVGVESTNDGQAESVLDQLAARREARQRKMNGEVAE